MNNNETSPQQPEPSDASAGAVPPVQAEAVGPARGVPPAQPIVVTRGTGIGRRLLMWIGWLGFFLCGTTLLTQCSARHDYYDTSGGVREKYAAGAKAGEDKVAIVRVSGVIMDGEGFVKHQIDRIREDPQVKAVVVRIDSPGGTITGSDYIYHHLTQLRTERNLPLVVSMGSLAASGGYYIAMAVGDQEQSIYAEPMTTTGSIGVIMPHYNISGLLERLDIEEDSVVSHPRKQMLSMTRGMSAEDRELVQQYVNEGFERFKRIVKEGRPRLRAANEGDALCDPQTGRNLATGEIFTATQAREFGLVDEIGFVEDATDRAVELAGLDPENVRVVRYQRPASLAALVGLPMARPPQITLTDVLDWSAPRAFYLASSLPALLRSPRQ